MQKKIAITTFGCKLNQAESAQLVEMLIKRGYVITAFEKPADVYIINSCTVTAKADARCRQAIRKARRTAPAATIIVTGCYAEVSPDKLSQIEGIDYILGSDYKFSIIDYLETTARSQHPVIQTCGIKGHPEFINPNCGYFLDNTRAFLKVQDGCNAFCSYCIVPFARGQSRSGALADILQKVHELIRRGYREIVLTGAHLGLYGQDLIPPSTLADLLAQIISIEGDFRIRLSSIEPLDVTPKLIDLLSSSPKICSHLHIPLQSGDDAILKAMNRNYSAAQFEFIIQQVLARNNQIALGTDIIVGFPGETESQFENSFQLIKKLPFSYLHVFPYSVRKGTAAARLTSRIPGTIQAERSQRLRMLGKMKRNRFHQQFLNIVLPVLFEQEAAPGCFSGLTPNYIRVKAAAEKDVMNRIIPVKIVAVNEDLVTGEIIKNSESFNSSLNFGPQHSSVIKDLI